MKNGGLEKCYLLTLYTGNTEYDNQVRLITLYELFVGYF